MKINTRFRNRSQEGKSAGRWWASCAFSLLFTALTAWGCGSRVVDDTGTETHWLKACNSDAECGGRLACLCNVCTRECSETAACPTQAPHCVGGEALDCSTEREVAVCFGLSENDLVGLPSDPDAGPPLEPVAPRVPDVDDTRPDFSACDTSGWCWESPHAPGERFRAFSSDRQFAVGEGGVVFSIEDGYLEPPARSDLTSVVVIDGQPWVGSGDGVWSHSLRGWSRHSDQGVDALAVTPSNEVWALRANAVVRLEIETWVDMTPTPAGKEMLFLSDLVANDDGTISVIGGYFLDKSTTDGVLFTWDGSAWTERAAGFKTGTLEFLEGPASPYVYHIPTSGDDAMARVYEPARDWQVVAETESATGGTVFLGPDGRWWLSSDGAVRKFGETQSKVPSGITCAVAINWDAHTVLCADELGGLNFLTVSESGVTDVTGGATFAPYAGGTLGTQPTPVWAQSVEVWGVDENNVWRAPLERYDGRSWQSLLSDGDLFSARTIDGTAGDDVWFASETELRHWDGRSVSTVELPLTGEGNRILALRTLEASQVRVLLETGVEPFEAVIASYVGKAWVTEYRAPIDVTHAHGSIAGASVENLWAMFGHQILRFRDGAWSELVELDPAEWIIHAVSDDATLWLLSDTTVYRLDDTLVTPVGYRPTPLGRLALTPDYVWNFEGALVRKLPR